MRDCGPIQNQMDGAVRLISAPSWRRTFTWCALKGPQIYTHSCFPFPAISWILPPLHTLLTLEEETSQLQPTCCTRAIGCHCCIPPFVRAVSWAHQWSTLRKLSHSARAGCHLPRCCTATVNDVLKLIHFRPFSLPVLSLSRQASVFPGRVGHTSPQSAISTCPIALRAFQASEENESINYAGDTLKLFLWGGKYFKEAALLDGHFSQIIAIPAIHWEQ